MTTVAPDGGFWGWMAVFACFMGNLIGDGVMYSFGVFLPKFKEHFQCGSGEISTIGSIQMGVCFGAGPVASYMTNRLGWRLTTVVGTVLATAGLCFSALAPSVVFLYFSAGGLVGLGLGIIYLPRLDCITQYFDKRRPVVTGIAICGSGIGAAVMAPFTDYLLNTYEFTTCFYILGGICATNCIFGLMFKPLPKTEDEETIGCENIGSGDSNSEKLLKAENDNKEESLEVTIREMMALMRDWAFIMFAISNFLTSLGYPIPYSFATDNAIILGLTATQGSYLVSLIGISNTVARLILGALSQTVNRLFLYNTCLVLCGLTMGLSNYLQPVTAALAGVDCAGVDGLMVTINVTENVTEYGSWLCDPYYGQVIYMNSYGVTSAAYVLLTTLVLADLFGPEKFANSFGLLLLFQGVATIIGPPIVGFMFDYYKSYNEGLLLMGAFIALSGLMLYPIPCIRQALEKRQSRGFSKCVTEQSIIKKDAKISIEESHDPEEREPII